MIFGALIVGANKMQRAVEIPSSLITVLNGLVVIFVVGSEIWRKRLARQREMLELESANLTPVEEAKTT